MAIAFLVAAVFISGVWSRVSPQAAKRGNGTGRSPRCRLLPAANAPAEELSFLEMYNHLSLRHLCAPADIWKWFRLGART
jgi:hypothetical protein